MLDIACHEISVLLGECHFVENYIFWIRDKLIAVHSLRRYSFLFDKVIQIANEFLVYSEFGTMQDIVILFKNLIIIENSKILIQKMLKDLYCSCICIP